MYINSISNTTTLPVSNLQFKSSRGNTLISRRAFSVPKMSTNVMRTLFLSSVIALGATGIKANVPYTKDTNATEMIGGIKDTTIEHQQITTSNKASEIKQKQQAQHQEQRNKLLTLFASLIASGSLLMLFLSLLAEAKNEGKNEKDDNVVSDAGTTFKNPHTGLNSFSDDCPTDLFGDDEDGYPWWLDD